MLLRYWIGLLCCYGFVAMFDLLAGLCLLDWLLGFGLAVLGVGLIFDLWVCVGLFVCWVFCFELVLVF